jgi:tRNA dimethylallyltransferase
MLFPFARRERNKHRNPDAVFQKSNYRHTVPDRLPLVVDSLSRAILSRVTSKHNPGLVAIVGPTASGKSALGIEVALQLNGEIINCDSVQVYREIEIATAKVPLSERRGVPHHLIDYVSPHVNYTAGDWARDAIRVVEDIQSRGRLPIFVGGTGFYLRAFRNPLFESPETNECLRRRLNDLRERHGSEHLHRLLRRIDPDSASQLYPRDWPRIQRAIEVRLQTGQSMFSQKPNRPAAPEVAKQLRLLVLNPPREELYARINERAEKHFADGLVAEVKRLLQEGVPADSNALGAHGYRRVVEFLNGKRDLGSAIEQTKLDVRHYAKRQLTWFRREPGAEWFEGFGENATVQKDVITALTAIKM